MLSAALRPLIVTLVFSAVGCGPPSVDVPTGNDKPTSDKPVGGDVPPPSVQAPPANYPYTRLALRGSAGNATRVFVEGAGNTVEGNVQPLDQSFCVEVDLMAAPAHYTLTVRSQSSDGTLSQPKSVDLQRDNSAPKPTDEKLCDGSPAGG